MIKDVINDILMINQAAKKEIGETSIDDLEVNVFRFRQSLDDPTLIFWRPWEIAKEWPYIFFLKINEGKLTINEDFGPTPIQKIDKTKLGIAIIELDIADK